MLLAAPRATSACGSQPKPPRRGALVRPLMHGARCRCAAGLCAAGAGSCGCGCHRAASADGASMPPVRDHHRCPAGPPSIESLATRSMPTCCGRCQLAVWAGTGRAHSQAASATLPVICRSVREKCLATLSCSAGGRRASWSKRRPPSLCLRHTSRTEGQTDLFVQFQLQGTLALYPQPRAAWSGAPGAMHAWPCGLRRAAMLDWSSPLLGICIFLAAPRPICVCCGRR